MTSKPTNTDNPKDAIGKTKLPMDLVPDTAIAELTTAFLEGALKYGRFNWRIKGVRASIYVAALKRHLAKWYNGEDEDAETTVNHLASVMACAAIILDAQVCGKLNDDRPPRAQVSKHIDKLADKVKHLDKLFEDEHPHQYTIADSETSALKPFFIKEAIEAEKAKVKQPEMEDYQGCHTRKPKYSDYDPKHVDESIRKEMYAHVADEVIKRAKERLWESVNAK